MRVRNKKERLSVHAISGTNTVLLGLDVPESARKGLLGFAIHRIDHTSKSECWLRGFRWFRATEPRDLVPGMEVETKCHPIQAFLWGDYTARPDHIYTYTVVSMYGRPDSLRVGKEVSVRVLTESEDYGRHAIFFNRGVAGSQAYARRFGNRLPNEVPHREAYIWLSRGLEEAILSYIAQASDGSYALRAAVYEFSYPPVLDAFAAAARKGVGVQIVYDRRARGPYEATEEAVESAGLTHCMIPRTKNPSYIAHNKFIVLLKNGKPIQVWTGSTNFTEGGIFGQSNVGHIVRDARVAEAYLGYWKRLAEDPDAKSLRRENLDCNADPLGSLDEDAIYPVFSPRTSLAELEWFAERMGQATRSSFLTSAFGVCETLAQVLGTPTDGARYIMLEKPGKTFEEFHGVPGNRVAIGAVLRYHQEIGDQRLHGWVDERLTSLNDHVRYLHTKYMLVDPLTENPTVISGSANFSHASVANNDENMLIIRSNKRVSDIFLGEFMRLFTHFYFRDIVDRILQPQSGKAYHLTSDDSWTEPYFDADSIYHRERVLFR